MRHDIVFGPGEEVSHLEAQDSLSLHFLLQNFVMDTEVCFCLASEGNEGLESASLYCNPFPLPIIIVPQATQ
jgi:hypothetical protein